MGPVAQCPDCRLDDIGRGFEIGLTDPEIDHIPAALLKRGGAGEDGEGVFFAYSVKSRNGLQQGIPR